MKKTTSPAEEIKALRRELAGLRLQLRYLEERLGWNSIHSLELTTRSHHYLERNGITTIGALVRKSDADLLKIKNLGRISLKNIRDALTKAGYSPQAERMVLAIEGAITRLIHSSPSPGYIEAHCIDCGDIVDISVAEMNTLLRGKRLMVRCDFCVEQRREAVL